MRELPDNVASALRTFRDELSARFGPRLLDVRLFGSYARGDWHDESDVDLLVVLDAVEFADREAIHRIVGATSHRFGGLLLVPVIVSRAYWDALVTRERLFAQEVERDGVPL